MADVGLNEIAAVADTCEQVIDTLRRTVFAPTGQKALHLTFNVNTAAMMAGRSDNLIREAERDGRLPAPRLDENGRRLGYTLGEVNKMRDTFGTRPSRAPEEEAILLAVQNFKGGVGKSTCSAHFAQYMALQGYRVLLVDCDSQASVTTWHGLNPDLDVGDGDTIYPFLIGGDVDALRRAIRQTHWDGLDLLPANLGLYTAEYQIAAMLRGQPLMLDRLRAGLRAVSENYDVVVMDPPPALGMISLSVLRAADAIVIPCPPTIIDFCSTSHFLRMLVETLGELERFGLGRDYRFVKLLATKSMEGKGTQTEILRMMSQTLSAHMMQAQLKDSAEFDNASLRLQTVYELSSATTSRQTFKRCRSYLDSVNRELELEIRKLWPSHHERLRDEGLL